MLPNFPPQDSCTVAVIGLGYVGLPLAVEFSKVKLCHRTSAHMYRRVIGFDINTERLDELRQGIDRTNEISASEFNSAQSLELTSDASILVEADVFVVTVPTPIDSAKRPDLSLLQKASTTVAHALKSRSNNSSTIPIVIYESTVYPGVTEEVCIPILEKESGLLVNKDSIAAIVPSVLIQEIPYTS